MKEKVIRDIYQILEDRRDNPIDSYTSRLMQDNQKLAVDKILEKIGEESAEVIIAAKNEDNLIHESADLIFHTLLLLVYSGVELDQLLDEFESRMG
ncbi:MAG TPA: phosphoribosyl-ATP diphosphatase [Methanobacteriaceae archaeon]|nr:phosphoribosyl-ATP diphosphatase [Methanobacteriaceae archaeon]